MKDVPVLSVKKALDLLELIAANDIDEQGIGLSVLARGMGLAPNTARNLLKTMIVCGFVCQNESAKYTLGPKCDHIGRHRRHRALTTQIQPYLEKLGVEVQEVVLFAILHAGRRITIAQVDPKRTIQVHPGTEQTRNLYEFVTGRVLLAYTDKQEWPHIIEQYGLPGPIWEDIDSEEKLQAAAEKIRKAGECIMIKKPDGLVALAVPVTDSQGLLLGSLGCYAPAFRCPEQTIKNILSRMKETANSMAEHIDTQDL